MVESFATKPAETSFDTEILKGETVSVAQLLGRELKEHTSLTIDYSNVHTYSQEEENGGTRYLAIVDKHLDKHNLRNLLVSIAPNPGFASGEVDILQDWFQIYYEYNHRDINQHLLNGHLKHLGQDFEMFAGKLNIYYPTIAGEYILEQAAQHFKAFDEMGLKREMFDDYQGTIANIYRAFPFWSGDFECVASLVGTDDEDQEKSIVIARVGDVDGSPRVIQNRFRFQLQLGKFARGELSFGYDFYATPRRTVGIKPLENTNYIIPAVSWTRDKNGNRSWDLEGTNDDFYRSCAEQFARENIHAPEGLEFDIERIDPIAGLMTTLYVNPEIKKLWEMHQGFVPGGFQQGMGAPQAPVRALLGKEEIITSDLLPQTEKHLARTAVVAR